MRAKRCKHSGLLDNFSICLNLVYIFKPGTRCAQHFCHCCISKKSLLTFGSVQRSQLLLLTELHIDHIVAAYIQYICMYRYLLFIDVKLYIVIQSCYVTICYTQLHSMVDLEDELENRLLVHLRAVGRPLAALGLAASLSLDG